MKIAYLSTFYPFRGGIAQFNASVFRELENQGHQVKAYTFTTQYPNFLFPGETQFVKEGDVVDKIDAKRTLHTANPFTWRKTAKEIQKFNPDLLIMKYWMSYFGPSLGCVAKNLKKHTKILTILDNVIPHEKKFFDSAFTKYFLKHNTCFVSMSEKVKSDLLSLVPNANVELLPHPLYDHFGEIQNRNSSIEKLGLDKTKKTLLFFGFIRDYKGLDLLIDSFGELDDSYQLIIAGETYGSFDKYDNQIEQNPNKDRIYKHVKYVSDSEVSTFFSAADVCILPYKSATQSGITGISYHFETPMIATNVGGLAEIIHHNKTGLIVENANSTEITKSIQKFFDTNPKKFCEEIKNLKHNLSWNVFTEKLLEFTNKIS